jgi:hypothetical protein
MERLPAKDGDISESGPTWAPSFGQQRADGLTAGHTYRYVDVTLPGFPCFSTFRLTIPTTSARALLSTLRAVPERVPALYEWAAMRPEVRCPLLEPLERYPATARRRRRGMSSLLNTGRSRRMLAPIQRRLGTIRGRPAQGIPCTAGRVPVVGRVGSVRVPMLLLARLACGQGR